MDSPSRVPRSLARHCCVSRKGALPRHPDTLPPAAGRAPAARLHGARNQSRKLTSPPFCLCAREPGASRYSPALPGRRAAAPTVQQVATRTSLNDGDPVKEETFSTPFYFLYLFPQLCPAEDRLGAGLHRDLDPKWEVQQPSTSFCHWLSPVPELERGRHSWALLHGSC